jgi:chromosome condensin MukBEF ATPase and DNA-binding subunit MukB
MVQSVRPSLLALVLAVALGGCAASHSQPTTVVTDVPDRESAAKRFQDPPIDGRTAVESAIELSEKYARLSDQAATLRQENQRLTSENDTLRQQMTALEAKLKQTQKELGEANDLLIEMLTELNNWKSNILGFRSEMRQAAQAQLEALLKVLEILGGEAEAGSLGRRHADTLSPDTNDMPRVDGASVSMENEPNGLH